MITSDSSDLTGTVTPTAATTKVREFLSRVLPWPVDENDPGFINVEWCHPHPKNPKHYIWSGKPTRSLDAFNGTVDWVKTLPEKNEIYFCTSRQSQSTLNKNGNPKSVRSKETALFEKAIWTDLDVKPGPNGYPSLTEAMAALGEFLKATGLPPPSAIVGSGGGAHVYWISDKPLPIPVWLQYAEGLKALTLKHGLHNDSGIITDGARVLRVPGTFNHKTGTPRPVKVLAMGRDYDFATDLDFLAKIAPIQAKSSSGGLTGAPASAFAALDPNDSLAAGIEREEMPPLDPGPLIAGCAFIQEAIRTGGKDYTEPLWNLTTLCAVFLKHGHWLAHRMGKDHSGYTPESTDERWERKNREHRDKGLGWPYCKTIHDNGCTACATCPHFAKGKSPLNLARQQQPRPVEPSFVDPYADFAGPEFPLDVLPPTLAKFVDAEHRAMGADPSALAMAALTAVAGAIHAETLVCAGEGWWERPIIWNFLIGPPSAMKSPIIDKTTKPLSRIDHERDKYWRQEYARWEQLKQATKTPGQTLGPSPANPPRCVINDATPEKVAEILSRNPSGSLMVHDELAGWIGSFERYSSGASSRSFFLSCWNGGTFLKDRVGRGKGDPDAEIRVDNLALCVLGGIQPDRLDQLGDLTSDGLLQRSLPCLMKSAERGDEYYPVAGVEHDYENLIKSVNSEPQEKYHFADDALEVRERVNDYLHRLEQVDGFSSALIGAIGKLKGYFARICLVLELARTNDRLSSTAPEWATPAESERLRKLFGFDPNDSLSAGISPAISRLTAEATEKVLRQYLLPHIVGLYDLVVNGGKHRDMLRSVGDFILASAKDRLRPSDITAGLRALRGQPEHKIREWAGRFCAMGWLQPEEEKPGVPPKAWLVVPGLREYFAERRKHAQAARAEIHAILKAGGSRKPS